MATSRTGTARWKRVVKEARARAVEQGLTRCPLCRVWLDWDHSLRPASPEVDHIIPHALGGKDELDATRIICRKCNQQLGGAISRKKPKPNITTTDLDASPIW